MNKRAQGEAFSNTRELVTFLNENEIKREDIVAVLMPIANQVFLIYYK
jgi:hypothetical protein